MAGKKANGGHVLGRSIFLLVASCLLLSAGVEFAKADDATTATTETSSTVETSTVTAETATSTSEVSCTSASETSTSATTESTSESTSESTTSEAPSTSEPSSSTTSESSPTSTTCETTSEISSTSPNTASTESTSTATTESTPTATTESTSTATTASTESTGTSTTTGSTATTESTGTSTTTGSTATTESTGTTSTTVSTATTESTGTSTTTGSTATTESTGTTSTTTGSTATTESSSTGSTTTGSTATTESTSTTSATTGSTATTESSSTGSTTTGSTASTESSSTGSTTTGSTASTESSSTGSTTTGSTVSAESSSTGSTTTGPSPTTANISSTGPAVMSSTNMGFSSTSSLLATTTTAPSCSCFSTMMNCSAATNWSCICPPGYITPKNPAMSNCLDVNECLTGANLCPAPKSTNCVNTPGSYNCTCSAGYVWNGTVCTDINECLVANGGCVAPAACNNTIGSFVCVCPPNFQLVGSNCIAIDQCALGTSGCQQICTSFSDGTYACSCQTNFGLQSDNKTCAPLTACPSNNTCSHFCAVNSNGTAVCSCPDPDAWTLGSDGKTCQLKDVCSILNPCNGSYSCNTKTSAPYFNCSCTNGYFLAADGVSCFDRNGGYTDWSAWGDCNQTCGTSYRMRYRTCTNPAPARYGTNCTDVPFEMEKCNTPQCPLPAAVVSNCVSINMQTSMSTDIFSFAWPTIQEALYDSINANCRSDPSTCCPSATTTIPTGTTLEYLVSYDGISLVDGYPICDGTKCQLLICVTANKTNCPLCNYSPSRRRRAIGDGIVFPQSVLVSILSDPNLQAAVAVQVAQVLQTAGFNVSMVFASVGPAQQITTSSGTSSNSANTFWYSLPTWAIVVLILFSCLIAAFIGVVIGYFFVKNKVAPKEVAISEMESEVDSPRKDPAEQLDTKYADTKADEEKAIVAFDMVS